MKKFLVSFALALTLILMPVSSFAQGVQSNQQGNIVYFSVYNDSGSTVCMFPYIISQQNVYGSVVSMIQVGPGENGVNIGAFSQANTDYAWSIQVGAKYHTGTCA
jgi:hypothetical protein